MNQPVVEAAEQHEVPEIGRPAVCPVMNVMGVAILGFPMTAGEGAAAVSDVQRASLARGDEPSQSSHIQRFTRGTHHDWHHQAVTSGEPGFGAAGPLAS